MILDILVFTLGFLVAGLLALAALPALWRRAMRLSGERLSRLVPLSSEEIAAERDHLRAAHAVDLRRTEQKVERAEAERARLMAEVSRRADRIAALDGELAQAGVAHAALAADTAQLRRAFDELQAEAGTAQMALHDASGLADKRWAEAIDLRLENQRLADHLDRDRASIAGLETRLLGAVTRAEDLARDLAAARAQTAVLPAPDDLAAAARSASLALGEAQRREIEHLTHEVDFAHEQAASAERRVADAAREIEKLSAERDRLVAVLDRRKPEAEAPGTDDLGRLRAALARLADDILVATDRAERLPSDTA